MHRAISILRDNCRTLSVSEFIAFVWGALFKSERALIYCINVQESGTSVQIGNDAFPIVKGKPEDLELARSQSDSVPWEFKCDLYDGVEDCFVHLGGGAGQTIGHISWLYYRGDPNRTLSLGERECEVMFCLTLPEFRGRGLYPRALGEILRYLKGRGYERCFICAADDNRASIRGIEKAGFRAAGAVTVRKVLGFQVSPRRDTRLLK